MTAPRYDFDTAHLLSRASLIRLRSPRNSESGPASRRGSKRASTSPGEEDIGKEASPPNKRQKPSPPLGPAEPPGAAMMGMSVNPQMNGSMQALRPQQTPMGNMLNGVHPQHSQMHGMQPGMGAGPMNPMHMQQLGAMGQPMMVGPQGQMIRPGPGPGQMQPGAMGQPPLGPHPGEVNAVQRQAEYRQSMAAVHNSQIYSMSAPEHGGPPGSTGPIPGPSQQPLNAGAVQMQRSGQQGHKQPFAGTSGSGVMAPPGSPASKSNMMLPPPTPKDENAEVPCLLSCAARSAN